ncbi:MAG: tyrosine-type recombinase/integrase [Planctomycetes bacterium]|nr:tyrosine-type recombinase/integrase [Planctomycetota bacterium]
MTSLWLLDERKFLTREEQSSLRSMARERLSGRPGERSRWIEWFVVELGLESGLRVGEMAALQCKDLLVELDRPAMFVRRGKGGKPRMVYVRRKFAEAVREFLTAKTGFGEPVNPDAPVFLSPRGGHLTSRALEKAYDRVRFPAGLDAHNPHHLRHTYASELYRASGGNLRLVQKQLGHARITTTQVYADVFDPDVDAAVSGLYARVGGN